MMAGGCVRDRLLKHEPKDYDLATVAEPQTTLKFFREKGYTVIPVGIEHGTVSVVTQIQQVEITTLREDVACDGRHAEVSFSNDFRQDALRRDFTINALFEDMNGQIHDFTGGVDDMNNHTLRFVGDAEARLREDYLRMLRYFRFMARLGWEPEASQLEAIRHSLDGLAVLSAERIHNELIRILMGKYRAGTVELMSQQGMLRALFDWFCPDSSAAMSRALGQFEGQDPAGYWFLLFHLGSNRQISGTELGEECIRLRFSKKGRKAVLSLNRVFQSRDNLWSLSVYALELLEKEILPSSELNALISCYPWEEGSDAPRILTRLIQELDTRPAPVIPQEALMQIEPGNRGKAIERVKIYWYCGLIDTIEELTRIMEDETTSRNESFSRDLFV